MRAIEPQTKWQCTSACILLAISFAVSSCGVSDVEFQPGPDLQALPNTTKKVQEHDDKISSDQNSKAASEAAKKEFTQILSSLPPQADGSGHAAFVLSPTRISTAHELNLDELKMNEFTIKGSSIDLRAVGRLIEDLRQTQHRAALTLNPQAAIGPAIASPDLSSIKLDRDLFIYADRFHLKRDEKILTQGHNLTIVATIVQIDGEICTTPQSKYGANLNGGNLRIIAQELVADRDSRIDLSGAPSSIVGGKIAWQSLTKEERASILAAKLPQQFRVNQVRDSSKLAEPGKLKLPTYRDPRGRFQMVEQKVGNFELFALPAYQALSAYYQSKIASGLHPSLAAAMSPVQFSPAPDQREASVKKIIDQFEGFHFSHLSAAKLESEFQPSSQLSFESGRNFVDLQIDFELVEQGLAPIQPNPQQVIKVTLPPTIIAANNITESRGGRPGELHLILGKAMQSDLLYSGRLGGDSKGDKKFVVTSDKSSTEIIQWKSILTAKMRWKHVDRGTVPSINQAVTPEEEATGSHDWMNEQKIEVRTEASESDAALQKLADESLSETVASDRRQDGVLLKAWSSGFVDQWIAIHQQLQALQLPGYNASLAPFQRFASLAELQKKQLGPAN